MKIQVLGAGMYVTGRNNSGVGTVLSSLIQTSKETLIEEIVVVARSKENQAVVEDTARRINGILKTKIDVSYRALDGVSLEEICSSHPFSCAVVSTPDHLHFEQLKILMRNGIHVLSVKPLVAATTENKELIESIERLNQDPDFELKNFEAL